MPLLSPTQLSLLTAALMRTDRLLVPPPTLKGGARERVAGALLVRVLVEGVQVAPEDPAWRRGDGGSVGLRVTLHGQAVLAATRPSCAPSVDGAPQITGVSDASTTSPRPWTKTAIVLGLLGREQGASLAEITAATGWLPHTARAALSRLRPAHPRLVRLRTADGRGRYCLQVPAPAADQED